MKQNSPAYMLILVIFFSYGLRAQSFPPPKPLTDEQQIRLILHKIEQGIKHQDILQISDGFARVYQSGDSTSARFLLWGKLRRIFEGSQQRWDDSLFQALTPMGGIATGTWDFEMEIDTLRILNDHTAQVKAWIYFGASLPDTGSEWKFGKKHRENIIFKRIDGQWRVKKVDKLLSIVQGYGRRR